MPRIYIILKCILLQNGKFWRDGFLIFFSKDLVEQCLYSVGCCFLLQIFVFNDTFNVQNFSIYIFNFIIICFLLNVFSFSFPFYHHYFRSNRFVTSSYLKYINIKNLTLYMRCRQTIQVMYFLIIISIQLRHYFSKSKVTKILSTIWKILRGYNG